MKLRGRSDATVDEKGRVKIPSQFRKALESEFPNRYYVTTDDNRILRIYPLQTWEKVEAKFEGSDFDPIRQDIQRKMNMLGDETDMDGQGRMLLPQFLREALGLNGDVHVVGMGNRLEVFPPQVGQEVVSRSFEAAERKELSEWNR